MSAFANALRSFHTGDLTQEQLLSEVYRQLAVEHVAPLTLLEILNEQKLRQPLPDNTHETVLSRITSWPQEATIATASSREQSSIANLASAPATIVLGDPSGGTDAGAAHALKSNRSPPVSVGSVLQGRFSLIALIGEGGMSRVYKAIDLRRVEAGAHDPYIAVKVLTVPFSHYFGSMAALQREAHKLQSLTHQNIVRVIDCDRDGQSVFMTMEYLRGESLYKVLRQCGPGAMPRAEAISIITSIAHALGYAHQNNIVHGDLKPGNVIVNDKFDVKVIDFGMARFIAQAGETSARASEGEPTALTPRYASPEMLAGRAPEPADDVYALACLAYEVLTGRHPFGRVEESAGRQPNSRVPRPTGMSRRRYRVLTRGLEFDRARRTPTVAQFLKEFRASNRDQTAKHAAWAGIAAAMLAAAAMIAMAITPRGLAGFFPAFKTDASAALDPIIRDCPTCPLMRVLPAGRFQQGAAAGDPTVSPFERPRHGVTIGYGFAMSSDEITVGEFKEFVDATDRNMRGCEIYTDSGWRLSMANSWISPGFSQSSAHPVTCVSWNDAVAYTSWLSRKAGHPYRLPSASEWEYAERAGAQDSRPWGAVSTSACAFANVADLNAAQRYPGWSAFQCSDGFVGTAPVGSYKTNAFGLNDMLGNVFEWVQDCWSDDYSHAPADGSAVNFANCRVREARGGSWFTAPQYVSGSYRNRFAANQRSASVGFRVVRESHE